jgi:deoxyribodipyrimidine photo-lyase
VVLACTPGEQHDLGLIAFGLASGREAGGSSSSAPTRRSEAWPTPRDRPSRRSSSQARWRDPRFAATEKNSRDSPPTIPYVWVAPTRESCDARRRSRRSGGAPDTALPGKGPTLTAGPTIVLFTRDLRVHDQPALSVAVRAGGGVVPLFVLDDTLTRHRAAANGIVFLSQALVDLREALRERGADLVVRRGDSVDETLRLAHAIGARSIVIGDDASKYAQRRRLRLELECRRERVELRIEDTVTAVPSGELTPAERNHYRLFSPYWRRWRDTPLPAGVEAPARIQFPLDVDAGDLPSLDELLPCTPSPRLPLGGEREARTRLSRWLRDGVYDYEKARNSLAIDGTSRLSPYLHFGCLSPRELVERARARGEVAEAFVRQLCWRDFYVQLLAAHPETVTRDLHVRTAAGSDDEESVARWAAGQTGVPIVDAAMRQLRGEGWIHNRGRLVAGSFLTKTLGIDWRRGAEVFFDLLVDGDVASNVGNWQWVAGTGVDPRPNRRFNPLAQAKRHDPEGDYVRRHVPELAGLEGGSVHEPWRAPLGARVPDYPAPMVDYADATARLRSAARHATRA